VSWGKRRGVEGKLEEAFTLDRGGKGDSRRRHPWRPARAPMGGGAPVNFRPWEGVGEDQLSEAKLVVGSVGSGVDGSGGLGGGSGTGRRGLVPAARRKRRGAAG
jgi:hypothetical protein